MSGGLTCLALRRAAFALGLLGAAMAWSAQGAAAGAAAASTPAPVTTAAQRAQQKAAAFARRQQAVQAHRAAVLDGIKREDAQRAPARPLPMPLPTVLGAPGAAQTSVLPAAPASAAGRGASRRGKGQRQPITSTRTIASAMLSPWFWARWRARWINNSVASRGGRLLTIRPSSRGVK